MNFIIKKCFIFEKYVGVQMEIYNVRSLDTFSSEVQSGKGAKRWEALLSEQASCM